MVRAATLAVVLLGTIWTGPLHAVEVTISGPVLSVYDDGFRIADDRAQAMRVFAWSLCGDNTRDHIQRGDRVTVEGDRDWRFVEARSVTKADGAPACPEDAAPRF